MLHVVDWHPMLACSLRLSPLRSLLGEDGDHIIALRRRHFLACVRLAINVFLHKEMSLLFEVNATISTGVARRVTELVPQLYHCSSKKRQGKKKKKENNVKLEKNSWQHHFIYFGSVKISI